MNKIRDEPQNGKQNDMDKNILKAYFGAKYNQLYFASEVWALQGY